MARLMTGDRPTGAFHVGHYAGMLQPLLALQKEHECFVEVADYHALTTHYREPALIEQHSREMVQALLAVGIDPARAAIFRQSRVPEHLEFAYRLGVLAPVGKLQRVPAYKEKQQEMGEPPSLGLLGYPVLMAADILVYRGEVVPVGDDQLPHLELARELARRLNGLYGLSFPEPQAALSRTPRLPGTDGRAKMSKSKGNCIYLADPAPVVREKVMAMVTDPQRVKRSDPGRPEVCPVYRYYEAFAPEEAPSTAAECRAAARGCVACKARLAGLVEAVLEPIRTNDPNEEVAEDVLRAGEAKARPVAAATLQELRQKTGLGGADLAQTVA